MRIAKVRKVKTPTRGTSKSAGLDFYVPDGFDRVILTVGEKVFIPSGIKAELPEGYALIAFNKSGVALKKSLFVGACVVCLLYTSPSPRDRTRSRMPSSA